MDSHLVFLTVIILKLFTYTCICLSNDYNRFYTAKSYDWQFLFYSTFQGQKERQRNGKFLNQKMILEKVKDDPGP